MKLELLGTKIAVLVTEEASEQKTAGGIILTNVKQESNRGIVIKKGLKCENKKIVEGSVVLFQPHQGTTLDYDGIKYQLFEEDSILAIVPNDG